MRNTSLRRSGVAVAALAVLALLPVARAQSQVEPATLVLRNGRIATVDDAKPQAQALAARGDTLVAVGTNEEIARYVGPATTVIDLQGRRAVPGFIEAHGHFTGVGEARIVLNLTRVKNWDEVVAMVKDAAAKAPPGEWIRGRGWHQEKWDRHPQPAVEGFPTHHSLSAVVAEQPGRPRPRQRPRLLRQREGHGAGRASRATPGARPGGDILKDAKGEPTGLFRETADGLLDAAYERARKGMKPEEREAEVRRQIQLASEEAVSKGVTSFQDAGSSFETIDVFKKVAAEGKLGLRLWVMIRDSNERMAQRLAAYSSRRRLRQAPDRPRHQAHARRRARLARRVAARALLGPALEHRARDDTAGHRRRRRPGSPWQQRLPALRPRHRRPRQPRDPGPLRGGDEGQPRQEGRPLARSSTRSTCIPPTSRASAGSA